MPFEISLLPALKTSVSAAMPEIVLLVAALALLLFRPSREKIGIVVWAALLISGLLVANGSGQGEYFSKAFVVYGETSAWKILILGGTAISFFLFLRDREFGRSFPETAVLLLFASFGAMLLVSARHLAVIYLAFEILSLASYGLVGLSPGKSRSTEAGIKYAIFGGASSAFLLYGISLVYGATGSLHIAEVGANSEMVGSLAVLFILVGILYKIAAAPFHYWNPDAIEGAPVSVGAYVSVVPKVAGLLLLLVLQDALGSVPGFRFVILTAALLSMAFGTLAALGQKNVKRMLAYSSIAHVGFMLVAVAADSHDGRYSLLFYLTVYTVMNLGAFLVVLLASEEGELADFRGLGKRAPHLAGAMAVFLFSLTGLPPLGGFVAKFLVIAAALDSGEHILVMALIVATVVSFFFYARILKEMYLMDEEAVEAPQFAVGAPAKAFLILLCLLLLYTGLSWGGAARWAQESTEIALRTTLD